MNYRINNNTLENDEGWSFEFRNPIKKILEYNTILVVLLDRELNTDFFQNIYAIKKSDGTQVWQILNLEELASENKIYVGIDKPYVDILKIDEQALRAFNWDGTKVDINVIDGKLINNPFDSRKGKRPW